MANLNDLDSFGDVAAEDDAVLDYFLTTDAVQKLEGNSAFLVLGRKGSGKTALVRHFSEGSHEVIAKPLNLRGYPWGVHAQRIDRGASGIEAYVSSWRYLIAVEMAAILLEHTERPSYTKAKELAEFFKDNYGGSTPKLSDILRPGRLRLSKISLQPQVMGNQLGAVEMDRVAGDLQLGSELDALSGAIIDNALAISLNEGIGPIALHFDELDQGLSRLDDQRKLMLIGLILAAREIRRECSARGVSVNPVVYLRTDLWDDLKFSDKNKISQTAALSLDWNSETLSALVAERLKAKISAATTWDDISDPDLMRGSQTKWNHVVSRTFLRPRDIIKFLNVALEKARRRGSDAIVFTNPDIVDAREEYSAYLKKELDDEILPHWPHWDQALRACSAIATVTFERDDFVREYESRRSPENDVAADDALMLLHRFSVIGYARRSGYGGSSWAFQYTDPEAGWDSNATKFKVHLGLKEYAKLRESRA